MSDREILEAQSLIGKLTEIFAEPAAVAAAKKLRESGFIGKDDTVVCNLTGNGLKQPEAVRFSEKEFTRIAPTLEALRSRIS